MQNESDKITPKEKAKYLNFLMPDVAKIFVDLKIKEHIDNDECSIKSRTYTKSFWEEVKIYI